jgi:hypothetical protein
MSRGPDAGTLLERALLVSAETSGCPVTLVKSDWTRWASATFAGARHMFTLTAAASPAFDAWLSALPEAEFALPGHLVADLVVEKVSREGETITAHLEILTIEER